MCCHRLISMTNENNIHGVLAALKNDGSLVAANHSDLQLKLEGHENEIEAEFSSFEAKASGLLTNCNQLINTEINTDISILEKKLIDALSLSFTLGQAVADASTYLVTYQILYYQPKQPKFSESDRKQIIEFKSAAQYELFRKLKSAEETITKFVTVCQSLLKAESTKLVQSQSAA